MLVVAIMFKWTYLVVGLAALAAGTTILWRSGYKLWVIAIPILATAILAIGFQVGASLLVPSLPLFGQGLYATLQPPLSMVVPVLLIFLAFSNRRPSQP